LIYAKLTFTQWLSVALNDSDGKAILIPAGFAHGVQTLEDNTEVLYMMTQFYSPEHGGGYRWNDSAFGIVWPVYDPNFIRDR